MKNKVVFMGTPEFSVPALKALIDQAHVLAVYTQPDKPVGRGLKLTPSPVKAVAQMAGIPVYTPEKVSSPDEIEKIKQLNPDFIVVVAYGQILKSALIEVPRFGTLNIHSSLLPRWRGAAPIQRAILAGDSKTGITTMKIVPKLDAGDILLQAETPIRADDTAQSVHDRLSMMGADLIIKTLSGIRNGEIKPAAQDESQVTYAHKLTKEMEVLHSFHSAKDVDLSVRALNPWPGVKIETENGLKLKLKQGRLVLYTPGRAGPAGYLLSFGGELFIQCQNGAYQITELQEDGKKAVLGSDFMNGLKGRGMELPIKLKGAPA